MTCENSYDARDGLPFTFTAFSEPGSYNTLTLSPYWKPPLSMVCCIFVAGFLRKRERLNRQIVTLGPHRNLRDVRIHNKPSNFAKPVGFGFTRVHDDRHRPCPR